MSEISETQGMVNEIKNESPLVDQIWQALEKSDGRENVNEARRKRQSDILKRLPPDFEMEMKAFAAYVENRTDAPLEPKIAGEILENLVRADINICPKDETEVAKLIRSVLKDTDMYQIEGIDKRMRNPDVAQINEEGKIVGAVEVKAGRIDHRGSEQLGIFKENITNLMNKLEATDPTTLREHGLTEVADNLDKLKVSDDFRVTLAIPFGAYNGDIEMLLKKEDFWKPEKLQIAKERIGRCKIIESQFSRKDLKIVTTTVVSWLQSKKP